MDCIFCKISNGLLNTSFLYHDDDVMAFADIAPIAPVHILIVPRVHIASMNDIDEQHTALLGKMLIIAKNLAAEKGIAEDGYKLLFRTGVHGGQEVPHIHLHLIGGAPLAEKIHPV